MTARIVKQRVDRVPSIGVSQLLRAGSRARFLWRAGLGGVRCVRVDEDSLKIEGTAPIPLLRRPQRFGGFRLFFECPACGRARLALFLIRSEFACRVCGRLAYPSQLENPCRRAVRRVLKLRAKLDGSGVWADLPSRPSNMRFHTYQRLLRRLGAAQHEHRRAFAVRRLRVPRATGRISPTDPLPGAKKSAV